MTLHIYFQRIILFDTFNEKVFLVFQTFFFMMNSFSIWEPLSFSSFWWCNRLHGIHVATYGWMQWHSVCIFVLLVVVSNFAHSVLASLRVKDILQHTVMNSHRETIVVARCSNTWIMIRQNIAGKLQPVPQLAADMESYRPWLGVRPREPVCTRHEGGPCHWHLQAQSLHGVRLPVIFMFFLLANHVWITVWNVCYACQSQSRQLCHLDKVSIFLARMEYTQLVIESCHKAQYTNQMYQ